MEEKTFYDIHLHAFNLSHPYLRAFIRRFNVWLFLAFTPIVAGLLPLLRGVIKKKLSSAMNLLAVMEDDIDSVFLMMENCLREDKLLDKDGLHIDGTTYKKIVLTPLMMDFGYKRMEKDENIHYNFPCRKPIRRQVIDVFNAVAYYHSFVYSDRYARGFPHLKPDEQGQPTKRIFEIYPFICINTYNYEYQEIVELLDKYFKDYKGDRSELFENNPKFDGDIENLTSNYAGGVKVYPPLDFDPWPANPDEKKKVEYLYGYCEERGIPVTTHGGEGGFNVLKKKRLKELASTKKWESVLAAYPKLKLNIAHFPVNEKTFFIFTKKKRLNQVLKLLANPEYENLYVDFSCRATGSSYYKALKKLIEESSDEMKEVLKKRILFGTDFSVNLMSVPSYNSYYDLFVDDDSLDVDEKDRICSGNPEKFLFS